jgi:hypothetical protein
MLQSRHDGGCEQRASTGCSAAWCESLAAEMRGLETRLASAASRRTRACAVSYPQHRSSDINMRVILHKALKLAQ